MIKVVRVIRVLGLGLFGLLVLVRFLGLGLQALLGLLQLLGLVGLLEFSALFLVIVSVIRVVSSLSLRLLGLLEL